MELSRASSGFATPLRSPLPGGAEIPVTTGRDAPHAAFVERSVLAAIHPELSLLCTELPDSQRAGMLPWLCAQLARAEEQPVLLSLLDATEACLTTRAYEGGGNDGNVVLAIEPLVLKALSLLLSSPTLSSPTLRRLLRLTSALTIMKQPETLAALLNTLALLLQRASPGGEHAPPASSPAAIAETLRARLDRFASGVGGAAEGNADAASAPARATAT